MDWIQGNRFMSLADYVYVPARDLDENRQYLTNLNRFPPSDYRYIKNTFNRNLVKDYNIIYTPTFYVDRFFEEMVDLNKKMILITHNCDINVNFPPTDNIIKWFTQNVNIVHDKIESIPIGLENDIWFKEVHKKDKMITKLQQSRSYRNLAYMNHSIKTYPKERQKIYNLLEGQRWVTSVRGTNPYNFEEYIDNIYNHKFVICPRGNGMDTHRLWETLYMGSVPIVKKDINNWFYNDMPILYVNEWEDITEGFLNDMWPMYENGDWDKEKLTFEYWKNKITNDIK